MTTTRLCLAALAAAVASLALAQSPATRPSPAAGKSAQTPAQQQGQASTRQPAGAAGAVQQCVACHGANGEGNAQGGYPRLAGQSALYLRHQLDSYANGTRRNPVMEPIAKGLSPPARAAAAAYYAAANPPAAASPAPQAAANARGEQLATIGDDTKQVQGCGNCHGPGGIGEPPEIPAIAGLDAAYLVAALNAFKSGTRRNDPGAQMRTVARGLSAEDMAAVAQYFAALPPPARPAPDNVVEAPSPGAGRGATTGSAGR